MEPTTLTENGAPAFATTYSSLLDLFGQLTRTLDPSKLEGLIAKCWAESPTRTLQLMAYTRDIRHGVGERRLFYYMAAWLMVHAPGSYHANLPVFLEQGYYRDLLLLMKVKETLRILYTPEVALFVTDLLENKGLSAKWAPSEGGRFALYAKVFAKRMGKSPKEYRKFLAAERARLQVLETYMCAQAYDDISFQRIPSQAMLKYKDAFLRTYNASGVLTEGRVALKERYEKYLQEVKAGTAKINSGTLMPHQLVKDPSSPTADALWNDLVSKQRAGHLSETIAICDVSGSMSVEVAPGVMAAHVAVALGLLIAEVSRVADRRLITFSATPSLVTIPQGSLREKVHATMRIPWGMNTNYRAVFKLLLEQRVDAKRLFVFSDMQFDASGQWDQSLHDQIAAEYAAAGRTMPEVIYWNLAAKGALPVSATQHGVALVSGFSSKLLDLFLSDKPLNPLTVMLDALDRYKVTPPVSSGSSLVLRPVPWPSVTQAVSVQTMASLNGDTDATELAQALDKYTGPPNRRLTEEESDDAIRRYIMAAHP